MNQTAGTGQVLGDKECINDFLLSQKQLASSYNVYAGECVNEQLRNSMLSILNDEHKIQADLFSEMQSRGWYTVDQADMNKINQAKQKFSAQP